MKKKIIVGGTLRDAADRVADAWRRAERGELVEAEDTSPSSPGPRLLRI